MAQSVSATCRMTMTAIETLGQANDLLSASASNRQVTHDQFNVAAGLNGSSTPPASRCSFAEYELTAGSATIDLDSVAGANGATFSAAGLKVIAILATADSENGAAITIKKNGTHGLNIGSADWEYVLDPGDSIMFLRGADQGTDITADTTDKIALSGTGTDAVQIGFLFG